MSLLCLTSSETIPFGDSKNKFKSLVRKAKAYIKKGDIFFAIKGKKKDGNFFVKETIKKGASFVVVNKINRSVKRSKQILTKFIKKKDKIKLEKDI